jgi:hypothetical protein
MRRYGSMAVVALLLAGLAVAAAAPKAAATN